MGDTLRSAVLAVLAESPGSARDIAKKIPAAEGRAKREHQAAVTAQLEALGAEGLAVFVESEEGAKVPSVWRLVETGASASTPEQPAPVAIAEPVRRTERQFEDIDVRAIRLGANARKLPRGDDAALANAVKDITSTLLVEGGEAVDGHGIRRPLRVRRREGMFEIVSGERRYHAARLAGLARVTCEVIELSDEEVLAEQLGDADAHLTPLEEAEGLERLRDRGMAIEEIAARVGKSERTVRARLALLGLCDEARGELSSGRLSLAGALLVASLTGAEAQREALADARRGISPEAPFEARDVRNAVARRHLQLVEAGFDLADATLTAAGACTSCPKRTAAQRTLWADDTDRNDSCTDQACFAAKREAHAARALAAASVAKIKVASPAEAKKLFFSDRLSYGCGYVDLNEPCEEIQAPEPKRAPGPMRHGGPEFCDDGKPHDFESGNAWTEDEEDAQAHAAFAAGCLRWETCANCEAWRETEPDRWQAPRGWTRPTWREALGEPSPSMVAIDPTGKTHELFDAAEAKKKLVAAGLVKRPERESLAASPRERDEHAIEREARDAARLDVLAEIAAAAMRKRTLDLKFWRFLAALTVRCAPTGIDDVVDRRGLKGMAELLAYIAEETKEGALVGLVVELLAVGADFEAEHEEGPLAVACRFFGLDFTVHKAGHMKRIKAAEKAKAKKKAEKATKKHKAAVAVASEPSAKEHDADPDLDEADDEAEADAGEDSSGVCRVCGCTESAACAYGEGRCAWIDASETLCSTCAESMQEISSMLKLSPGITRKELLDRLAEEIPAHDRVRANKAINAMIAAGEVIESGSKKLLSLPVVSAADIPFPPVDPIDAAILAVCASSRTPVQIRAALKTANGVTVTSLPEADATLTSAVSTCTLHARIAALVTAGRLTLDGRRYLAAGGAS